MELVRIDGNKLYHMIQLSYGNQDLRMMRAIELNSLDLT